MQHQDGNEYEQRLRAAFEPDTEAVNRVVSAAMRPRSNRSTVLRAAAAFLLAGTITVWLLLSLRPSTVKAESIRLEYVGEVALVEFPDGSCLVVTPDSSAQAQSAPLNLVIFGGDKP